MYNQERKEKYIEEKEQKQGGIGYFLKELFEKTAALEKMWNLDVSEFNFKQIDVFFESLHCGATFPVSFCCFLLEDYAYWLCVPYNYFSHLPEKKLKEYVSRSNRLFVENDTIISFENLHLLMDQMLNPCDRCIFYALFEGIKGRDYCELLNLKRTSFHRRGNEWHVILTTGQEIPVTSGFARLALQSADISAYVSYNEHIKKIVVYPLGGPEEIIKIRETMLSWDAGRSVLEKRMNRIREILDITNLSVTTLRYSGLLYYMKKTAKELGVSPLDLRKNGYFPPLMSRFEWISKPERLEKKLYDFLAEDQSCDIS